MSPEKLLLISKGLVKSVFPFPVFKKPPSTGGTSDSRYCYSVWLRHLILLNKYGIKVIPENVAELGPGDSLGMGIAALLSGTKKYFALDVYKYWDPASNLRIFDELVLLFRNKASLAREDIFPKLIPLLDNYDFPADILTNEVLNYSLSQTRIDEIRKELGSPGKANKHIEYFIPWSDPSVIKKEEIDLIISQSVLQFVNLRLTYRCMQDWLKPGGVMAHVIDFSSHGITKIWNGQWTFSQLEWKLYGFRKIFLLNRASLSEHIKYNELNGFKISRLIRYKKENILHTNELASEYKKLSNDDLSTSSGYILSIKAG